MSRLENQADGMLIYLKSLRSFPRDLGAPPVQQTATSNWIAEIRQQAAFLSTTTPAAGLEDLDLQYKAVARDIVDALDRYSTGAPETNQVLARAINELADARRITANIQAAMLGGQKPPFHIATPTR